MNDTNRFNFTSELQTFLGYLPSPVVVIDKNRNLLWENRKMTAYRNDMRTKSRTNAIGKILGCTHAGNSSKGCGFKDTCRQCELKILVDNTFRMRQQGACTRFRVSVSEKRSRLLELFTTYVMQKDNPAVIMSFKDETELRSKKNLLTENKKHAADIQATGSLCHELAQPLMTISGYIQLMLMDTEKDSTRYTRLEKINDQVLRISAITREIMNIKHSHLTSVEGRLSEAAGRRRLTLI